MIGSVGSMTLKASCLMVKKDGKISRLFSIHMQQFFAVNYKRSVIFNTIVVCGEPYSVIDDKYCNKIN